MTLMTMHHLRFACFLILAFCGSVLCEEVLRFVHENGIENVQDVDSAVRNVQTTVGVVEESHESVGRWRKMLEDYMQPVKPSSGKVSKPQAKKEKVKVGIQAKGSDTFAKAKVNAGKKEVLEENKKKAGVPKSKDQAGIKTEAVDPESNKENVTAAGTGKLTQLTAGGKPKKVFDEEEDDDLQFMEDEKVDGNKLVADGEEDKFSSSEKNEDDEKEKTGTGEEDLETVVPEKKSKKSSEKEDNSSFSEKSEAEEKKKGGMDEQELETAVPGKKTTASKQKSKDQGKDSAKNNTTKSKVGKESSADGKQVTKEKLENSNAKSKPEIDAKVTNKKNATKKGIDAKSGKSETKKNVGGEQQPGAKAGKQETKPKKDKSKDLKDVKQQIAVNFPDAGAGEDVEDLQTDAGMSKTGVDVLLEGEAKEEDEDDDFDFIQEVSSLPTKLQETAGHVADKLLPGIQKISEKSKDVFTHANQQMADSFTPIMGDQVAPVVASLISYALLLVPLVVVLYMLERIRASLSLAKVLFFVNVYLGAYFLTLVLATFALHAEPMAFFFKNSRSSCIFLQLLQAFGYLFYLLLYTVVFVKSCSHPGFLQKLSSGFQWVIVALFGLHYYVSVFHRAMAMKVPRTTWKVYAIYSVAFAVLSLFARANIEPSKKEYYYSSLDDPDEVVPVDKRS